MSLQDLKIPTRAFVRSPSKPTAAEIALAEADGLAFTGPRRKKIIDSIAKRRSRHGPFRMELSEWILGSWSEEELAVALGIDHASSSIAHAIAHELGGTGSKAFALQICKTLSPRQTTAAIARNWGEHLCRRTLDVANTIGGRRSAFRSEAMQLLRETTAEIATASHERLRQLHEYSGLIFLNVEQTNQDRHNTVSLAFIAGRCAIHATGDANSAATATTAAHYFFESHGWDRRQESKYQADDFLHAIRAAAESNAIGGGR